jgi:DNA end-binding protein Ku
MASAAAGTTPRAQWKAVIELPGGAMSVPVKLYTAVRPKGVSFRMLHDQDETPVRQVLECPAEGKEVPREHAVKGFELRKDRYVVVTEEDLEGCGPVASRTIEVRQFVDPDTLDPVYFDKPYLLGPDTGGQKAFTTLLRAMEASHKVAIVEFVLRGKQYLGTVRPYEGRALCLETMHYADEIVDIGEIQKLAEDVDRVGPQARASGRGSARRGAREQAAGGGRGDRSAPAEREVEMARQLVESLAASFDPSNYHDEYTACVTEMLERKAAGQKIDIRPVAQPKATRAPDLTAVLKASLEHVRSGKHKRRGGSADSHGGANGNAGQHSNN